MTLIALSTRAADGDKVWAQNPPPDDKPARTDAPRTDRRQTGGNRQADANDAPPPPRHPLTREEWFKCVDTNGDGLISMDELLATPIPPPPPSPEELFKYADKDGNGFLSLQEFMKVPHPPPPPMPPGMRDDRPPHPPEAADVFKHLDADGDGQLSLEEFRKGARPPRMGPPPSRDDEGGQRPPPPDGDGPRPDRGAGARGSETQRTERNAPQKDQF